MKAEIRRFDDPDESREFAKGYAESG